MRTRFLIVLAALGLLALSAPVASAREVYCVRLNDSDVVLCQGYSLDPSKYAICFGQYEEVNGVVVYSVYCAGDLNCFIYLDPLVGAGPTACGGFDPTGGTVSSAFFGVVTFVDSLL